MVRNIICTEFRSEGYFPDHQGAFTPTPGLKEFLQEVKRNGIKIGLVTSGLYDLLCDALPLVLGSSANGSKVRNV